jgi:hypothetical protein
MRASLSPQRATSSTPSQMRQEIAFLKHKLEYQQSLLEDERRITDDLLVTKNKAIETFQKQLEEVEKLQKTESERLKQSFEEVHLYCDRLIER